MEERGGGAPTAAIIVVVVIVLILMISIFGYAIYYKLKQGSNGSTKGGKDDFDGVAV